MELTLAQYALLFAAGIWAGALNAIAGGGTFFTFPILLLMGMPPIAANTTNKFALWFASLSGVVGFWREIKEIKALLPLFLATALIGSLLGSLLLLWTPPERFEALIPWLMLTATCLFAFGSKIKMLASLVRSPLRGEPARASVTTLERVGMTQSHPATASIALGQFTIGIYGGFFAAGMGILMMALYEVAGIRSIHHMNALKNACGLAINGISAITFLFAGAIYWPVALVLLSGALIGGYAGAVLSKRVPDHVLKRGIILYGVGMTLYFFIK